SDINRPRAPPGSLSENPRGGRHCRSGSQYGNEFTTFHGLLLPMPEAEQVLAFQIQSSAEIASLVGGSSLYCFRSTRQTSWRHSHPQSMLRRRMSGLGACEIIGEDVQRHFAGDVGQTFHQEVRRAHAGFDRAEGVLDRLAPRPHGVRICIEPSLDLLHDLLVLPAGDPALLGRRALALDCTGLAGSPAPVTTKLLAAFN